jgi:outer membrane protein OmpA-like peptidoglycan-associated protein
MKPTHFIYLVLLVGITTHVSAQSTLDKAIKKTGKRVEKKVENRVNNRIDKGIDKALDEVEESVTGSGDKGKPSDSKSNKSSEQKNTPEQNSPEKSNRSSSNNNKPSNEEPVVQETEKPELVWSKYDFVPGTEIFFEDNQEGEQNGEFPSKWDLVQGSFENAGFDGSNVIYHMKCNMNGGGGIVPMLKNCKDDYLPEDFTIEFDAYFTENHSGKYVIYFGDYKNQLKLDKEYLIGKKWIRICKNSVEGEGIETSYYPGYKSGIFDKTPKWRHVAISFNKRALKVYLDDARVLNIPNLGYNPTGFTIGKQNVEGKDAGYTKNFRFAKGAVPLYDKFLTDGKFVTTGIKFDVNKATIKPESMGTINYVVKMMTEHPDLKFNIEGHTDSDGDDASNLKLSENRSKAVLQKIVEAGIAADRLSSKGWGESKPMAGNDTPEGKAQNRRVEFVKF